MAQRPSWRGHLKLSLVTCPVALFNAITPAGDVRFHLINPETGNRVRSVTVDSETEEVLDRRELAKGYEIGKGRYVALTPKEIDAVRLESTKTIEIEEFVPIEDIDRLYWNNPYYLVPDGKLAAEPFAVILAAMEANGKVGLGRAVISQRERLLALEPRDGAMIATTLRSRDEVRALKPLAKDLPRSRPSREMINIAEKIMKQKSAAFNPTKFVDRYEDALRDLIRRKEKGKDVVEAEAPAERTGKVIDLMEALRGSLKGDRERRRAPAKRTTAKRGRAAAARTRTPRKTARK
jgi:DNA end-binding protein Ku